MIKPNLFIVGAPKTGTTSLYKYLSKHPSIFFPNMKEPHYFTLDSPKLRRVNTLSEYLELFSNAQKSHDIVGDASVSYLSSKIAIKKIKIFNPDAKIMSWCVTP